MSMRAPSSPALFRASAFLFQVPGTTQPVDFKGNVTGVTGVPGFSAHTRARAWAHMRTHAGTRSRGRVHPITPVTPITK